MIRTPSKGTKRRRSTVEFGEEDNNEYENENENEGDESEGDAYLSHLHQQLLLLPNYVVISIAIKQQCGFLLA